MSVAPLMSWRLPGCSPSCRPNNHNPEAHEQYGRIFEQQSRERIEALGVLVVRTGGVLFDGATGMLTVNDLPTHVTPIESALLTYLGEHMNQVCGQDDILDAIWRRRHYDAQQVAPSSWQTADRGLIRTHVSRLRQKLGQWRNVLVTVDGRGYQLRTIAPAPWLDDVDAPRPIQSSEHLDTIGARIRKLRRDCFWTQPAMAEAIGVARETVAKWETNVWEPSLSMQGRIVEVFGIDPSYLRGRS